MERQQRKQKECKQLNINTMFEEGKNNSILKEGPMCEKSMSPGEEIAERLKGYSPSDKKRALREAEDIINKGYAFEMEKIKGMESALNKEWEEFQQS